MVGMLIAFLAMVNYIFINSKPSTYTWENAFVWYNLILYLAGIAVSYCMYITFSVVEISAPDANRQNREQQVKDAQNLSVTTHAKIGNQHINL